MSVIAQETEDRIIATINAEHKLSVRELEHLSKELQPGSIETFSPNCFYGNSYILKSYACIDPSISLPVVIPHGVNLSHTPWAVEVEKFSGLLLCHSDMQARDYQNYINDKFIIPIGAPYLYASRLVSRYSVQRKHEDNSIIVFPAHSTHHLSVEFKEDEWMGILKELNRNAEVLICLYWRDIQLGKHLNYIKEGFDVTTCGHMYDEMFLIRLAKIVHRNSSCLINRIGSCAFYSAVDGLDVAIVPQDIDFQADNVEMKSELTQNFNAWHAIAFNETFTYPTQLRGRKQSFIASIALGKQSMRNGEELKSLLLGDVSNQNSQKYVNNGLNKQLKLPESVLSALNF